MLERPTICDKFSKIARDVAAFPAKNRMLRGSELGHLADAEHHAVHVEDESIPVIVQICESKRIPIKPRSGIRILSEQERNNLVHLDLRWFSAHRGCVAHLELYRVERNAIKAKLSLLSSDPANRSSRMRLRSAQILSSAPARDTH